MESIRGVPQSVTFTGAGNDVGQSIIFPDYKNADAVMVSPSALKKRLFDREIVKSTAIRNLEIQASIQKERRKTYLKNKTDEKDDFKDENIQICIQNNDKLMGFLSSIKSKKSVSSVVLTTQSDVVILIKSQTIQPVLVMRFPINIPSVYSASPNQILDLPIDDLITKPAMGFSTREGYALYYTKSSDGQYQLFYQLGDGTISIPQIKPYTLAYVNRLLQPMNISGPICQKSLDEDNLTKLNNISLLMLINIPTIQKFKDIEKDQKIKFVVEDVEGIPTFVMKSEYQSLTSINRPIANRNDSIIWQFNSSTKSLVFEMYNRTTLLLQAANSKIKIGSDNLYFAFGRYGSEFVFMKIITASPVNISTSIDKTSGIINLYNSLRNIQHLFEMYFCHV